MIHHLAMASRRKFLEARMGDAKPFGQHRDPIDDARGLPITARDAFICSSVIVSQFSKNRNPCKRPDRDRLV